MTRPARLIAALLAPGSARGHSDAFRDRLDLAQQAEAMAAGVPARPIPIHVVPRAAIEALVAQLITAGTHHVG